MPIIVSIIVFAVASLFFLCLTKLMLFIFNANGEWRARKYREVLEKQSDDFAAAYNYSLSNKPTRYADLPVMPVRIPYNSETRFAPDTEPDCEDGLCWQMELEVKTEDFLNEFIAKFDAATGGKVALMRGETDTVLRQLGGDKSLVAVEEVKSQGNKKGDLAIAVLRVGESEKGTRAHVAFSWWPKSVWPGYSGKKPGSIRFNWDPYATDQRGGVDWEETWHMWYFKPRAWRREGVFLGGLCIGNVMRPEFDEAVVLKAEELSVAMFNVLSTWADSSNESTNDERSAEN